MIWVDLWDPDHNKTKYSMHHMHISWDFESPIGLILLSIIVTLTLEHSFTFDNRIIFKQTAGKCKLDSTSLDTRKIMTLLQIFQLLPFKRNPRWHYSKCHNECDGVNCLLKRLFRCRTNNLKAPHHWSFWGEFTSDRWIPPTKGQ